MKKTKFGRMGTDKSKSAFVNFSILSEIEKANGLQARGITEKLYETSIVQKTSIRARLKFLLSKKYITTVKRQSVYSNSMVTTYMLTEKGKLIIDFFDKR